MLLNAATIVGILILCTRYRTQWYPVYYMERFCCPGWRGYPSCYEPICNPPCANGGTCYAPDRCRCQEGNAGSTCQIETCSHLQPCFPGTCTYPNNCQCQQGFGGSHCLQISEKPDITKSGAYLANIKRPYTLLYQYLTDSTMPNSEKVDRIWINMKDFNYIQIYFEAMYIPPTLVYPPRYVMDYSLGIINGSSNVLLEKIPRPGSPTFVSKNYTYSCGNVPAHMHPQTNVFNCNITDRNFDRILEHGDNLTVTVTAENGGYQNLSDLNTNRYYQTNNYTGRLSHKSMMFQFDFEPAIHCSKNPCTDSPLSLSQDITKSPLNISWSGWQDLLSGIELYTWEVFKLAPQMYTEYLVEPRPMRPLEHHQINSNNVTFPKYTPPESGMYSIILDVVDRANNSRRCRRLALYDSSSSITINKDISTRLYIGSAANETNNRWQSNLQDENGNGEPIYVIWRGHFENKVHVKEKLLNKVLPFPRQELNISDSIKRYKEVESSFDDNEGQRTLNSIPNVQGIVNFDFAYKRDHDGGTSIEDTPPTGWIRVHDPMAETFTFNASRRDGDTIRIWIKARDVMNNTKVDSTVVNFDSSTPIIVTAELQQNVENGTFPFSSRVVMEAHDPDSGIHQIRWELKDSVNGRLFKEGTVKGNKSDACEASVQYGLCYELPTRETFYYIHQFTINNCWMVVSKDKLNNQTITLALSVYNMAMLSDNAEIKISSLRTLAGMDDYSGPMNLRVTQKLSNGVRLEWDQSPSCYDRTDIQIRYRSSSGQVVIRHISKDATWMDLVGLDPEKNYTIEFVTVYGDQRSDAVKISFITPPKKGLESGIIAAIVVIMLILVAIIIVGVVLWRTGRLELARKTIHRRLTKHPNKNRRNVNNLSKPFTSFDNKSYIGQGDDDLYLYGGMDFGSKQTWHIPHSQIVLEDKFASGRFADIYKAKRQIKQNDKSNVVAKIMKENHNDQDEFLMRAKINFFATNVGSHPNVLGFVGAVIDHNSLGPFMILEFCEEGTLKDWLLKKKDSVTDDVIERLCRISCGVAKGMEYLSSKKIVHRRLAARNIYLTYDLEAKVAGFGPAFDQNETDETDLNNKQERIPVKWMAPECMTSTKDADEASDVWSFGIVLWEIFSLGETPYPDIRSRDVPDKVEGGYRMQRPKFAEDVHNDLMQKCWTKKPKSRPTFKNIALELANTFVSGPSDEFYYYAEK